MSEHQRTAGMDSCPDLCSESTVRGESMDRSGVEQAVARVLAELAPVAQMLSADGYALRVTHAGIDQIDVAIDGLDDACAECLVGPDLLTFFMTRELQKSRGDGQAPRINLAMPAAAP